MNERQMISEISKALGSPYAHLMVPNTRLLGYEIDLAVMSNSGYLFEIECKTNISDLKKDQEKKKWKPGDLYNTNFSKYVRRFYIAIPFPILQDFKWSMLHPQAKDTAGLIVVSSPKKKDRSWWGRGGGAKIQKKAKQHNSVTKLSETQMSKLRESAYFGMWSYYRKQIE